MAGHRLISASTVASDGVANRDVPQGGAAGDAGEPLRHKPVAAVGNPELNRCTGLAQSHHVRGPQRRKALQAQRSHRRMFKFASDPAG